MKILYYLCNPFRTQNATASNQVVFSDGLHVMSLPEGICERVVIGSQARLRIWCLRAYGFESLRSHIIKRSRSVFPGLFFCACGRNSGKCSGPRGLVPLCHCVTSPEGERKRLPPFRSLARFLEIEECSPVSFFIACGWCLEKHSGPRGLVPLCHCVTSPEGEWKRLSPFRSLARCLEVEEYSSVFFKPSCRVISGKLSGRTPHPTDKLCVYLLCPD